MVTKETQPRHLPTTEVTIIQIPYTSIDDANGHRPQEYSRGQETEAVIHAKRAGGIFGVGGRMGFKIEARNGADNGYKPKPSYVYPTMSLTDNKVDGLKRLRTVYGGSLRRDGKSWRWELAGRRALILSEAIEPFAPARARVVEAMREVDNPDLSFEEKRGLAKSLGENDLLDLTVPVATYLPLVQDPAIVAGIVDARADERLTIRSINFPLIKALYVTHGGWMGENMKEGDIKVFNGKPIEMKHTSYTWRPTDDVRGFLRWVQPYLVASTYSNSYS